MGPSEPLALMSAVIRGALAVSRRSALLLRPLASVTLRRKSYLPSTLGVKIGPGMEAEPPLKVPDAPESAGQVAGHLLKVQT